MSNTANTANTYPKPPYDDCEEAWHFFDTPMQSCAYRAMEREGRVFKSITHKVCGLKYLYWHPAKNGVEMWHKKGNAGAWANAIRMLDDRFVYACLRSVLVVGCPTEEDTGAVSVASVASVVSVASVASVVSVASAVNASAVNASDTDSESNAPVASNTQEDTNATANNNDNNNTYIASEDSDYDIVSNAMADAGIDKEEEEEEEDEEDEEEEDEEEDGQDAGEQDAMETETNTATEMDVNTGAETQEDIVRQVQWAQTKLHAFKANAKYKMLFDIPDVTGFAPAWQLSPAITTAMDSVLTTYHLSQSETVLYDKRSCELIWLRRDCSSYEIRTNNHSMLFAGITFGAKFRVVSMV